MSKSILKIAIICILALVFIQQNTFAQSKKAKDLLCKKWKIDMVSMKKMLEEEMSKKTKEEQEEVKAMQDFMMGMLESMTMEFKPNGEMVTSVMGENVTGTWVLSDNDQTLTTKENKKEDGEEKDPQKMKVHLLAKDKFKFSGEQEDEGKSIILIPAE